MCIRDSSNTATSNVTYADGTTGTLTGSTKVSIDAPQPSLSGFKSGPSSVPPGGALEWRLLSANNGHVNLHDFQVVDSLPVAAAGNLLVENVQLVRKLTSAMPLSPNTGTCCWSGAATV